MTRLAPGTLTTDDDDRPERRLDRRALVRAAGTASLAGAAGGALLPTRRAAAQEASPRQPQNTERGRLTVLRVQEVGSGFNADGGALDVEVVFGLDIQPGVFFGFQLRDDANGLAHRGMLDTLRDAWNNDWPVLVYYLTDPGSTNGYAYAVVLSKP
jgi:hypothetical protein